MHTNVEVGQVARDDTARGMRAILSRLAMRARLLHDEFPHESWRAVLEASGPDDALGDLLSNWCVANPTPLVLLVDEIDSLVGDTLLSVLRQLRAGYEQRPEGFPQSVVLCGVRGHSGLPHPVERRGGRRRRQPVQRGGEVAAHGGLHGGGGPRADGAAHGGDRAALHGGGAGGGVDADSGAAVAGERAVRGGVLRQQGGGGDRSRTIAADDIHAAREELILSRRTHLDQLAHKLEEARVRRVVEPILSGGAARHEIRDLEYVRDLGLIDGKPAAAHRQPDLPEAVPRELGYILHSSLDQYLSRYLDGDGGAGPWTSC